MQKQTRESEPETDSDVGVGVGAGVLVLQKCIERGVVLLSRKLELMEP